ESGVSNCSRVINVDGLKTSSRPKNNPETGKWEGESFFIDVDCFNRDTGFKLADLVMQSLKKGSQVFIEGRLRPNEYTDKMGAKVFKPVLVADVLELLDPRPEGMGGGSSETGMTRAPRPAASTSTRAPAAPAASNGGRFYEAEPDSVDAPPGGGNGNDDDIPF